MVEYWKGKAWKDTGLGSQPIFFNYIQNATGVFLSRFQSLVGVGELNITYAFYFGSAMKHIVVFKNLAKQTYIFRALQVWNGIVGNKVRSSQGLSIISSATTLNNSWFEFEKDNGALSILENQESMYFDINGLYLQTRCLQPVTVNVHANGMKCNFIFSSWTLTQNEILIIDPDTATLNDPTEDGTAYLYLGSYSKGAQDIYMGKGTFTDHLGSHGDAIRRGYVEWDTSSIPDGATITDTVFKYHGGSHTVDCHIHAIANRPSTSSAQTVYDDCSDGTVYADVAGFPVTDANQQIDLGATADSDLQASLSTDWFAIGIQADSESGGTSIIYAEEYASANPKPTLYVEYTPPNSAPIINRLAITSGSTNSTTINPVQEYNFTVECRDLDQIKNLKNVTIILWSSGYSEGQYNIRYGYRFQWYNSSGTWAVTERNPDSSSPYDHLNVTRSTKPSDWTSITWQNFTFSVWLSGVANPTTWTWKAYVIDASDAQATKTMSFSINQYLSYSLSASSIDWGTLLAGDDNITATTPSNGLLKITITCNYDVKIQMKGSGDLSSNGYTIPLENCYVGQTNDPLNNDGVKLTTNYQTFKTGITYGENQVFNSYWFMSIPEDQEAEIYTFTWYIQVITQ